MLPRTQNVEKERKEDTDSSKGDILKEDSETKEEGFGSFRGFSIGFMEETLPSVGKTQPAQDDTFRNAIFQVRKGGCDMDASQQTSTTAEALVHECLEVDTQVTTTSQEQLTSSTGIRDIKKKIPGLADLILPTTPASPRYEGSTHSVLSTDSDIDEADSPVMQPLLRMISVSAHGRMKTRLQDPLPLTPAVRRQLTHCSSSLLHRRASLFAANEQKNARPDDVSGGKNPLESNQKITTNPISNSGPGNKNSSFAPPASEEEGDPLDDDIILASKKKKVQESKWDIYLQWIILLLLIAFLACLVKIKLLKRAKFLGLDLWRWVGLILVVFCGRLISGWIVKLLEILIEKHYILKNRVLYFVYGLRRAVKNCVWLALVLSVWEIIFRGLEYTTAGNVLTKILWCSFITSLSWMLKVLAVKVAANSFHRKAYFDRIQECIFNQYLLEVLSGPPTMVGIVDTGSGQDGFGKQSILSKKKKPKKQFGESHMSKPQKNPAPHIQRSRRLSRQISIETPGYTTVEVGELPAPFVSNVHTPSRRKISMTNQGPLIARSPIPIEQEKLQELTSDTVSVWTMKRLMKLIRNTNISTYSSIISQEMDEGEINSEMQAKAAAKQEMNVLNTIFLGPSNEKVYFPNSLLSMKVISNYYRSPDQGDAIEFQIHMSTPVEKLGILKERMQRYIESLPQFWYPDFRIVCDKILDSNKMNMAIWMRHRLNFQDLGERFQRRSNMLLYLKQQLEDLGIGYQLPGQEITVRGIPLLTPPCVLP